MKVVLDTNVLLDLFLNRQPWNAEAASVWDAHHLGQIEACVAGFALPTIHYISRRHAGQSTAAATVRAIISRSEPARTVECTDVRAFKP